ncbi:MAG: hypothetical protein O2930_05495 [Acidobacteria bacterium]|nr:hypothetical protein [Acidobacteriota bacterium]
MAAFVEVLQGKRFSKSSGPCEKPERAEAAGVTIPGYLERLVRAEQSAEDELKSLALEGLHSGDPMPVGPGCGDEQHRHLDSRLKKTDGR